MKNRKNFWIFAGEASGDMYGAEILSLLKKSSPQIKIFGMGGAKMKLIAPEIFDSSKLGVIGFVEVIKKLPLFLFIFWRFTFKALFKKQRPDIALMIDYPGFNFPLAKKLKKRGTKIFWFISPQVWAWKEKRIPKIAKLVDKMFVIFPFEINCYKETSLDVEFVGHPLIPLLKKLPNPKNPNLILILPGSRTNEVQKLLPYIYLSALKIKKKIPKFIFKLPIALPHLKEKIIKVIKKIDPNNSLNLELVDGNSHQLMKIAHFGIASSGTITIEASILKLPLVIVYKVSPTSYKIIKKHYKLPYFAMPNILLNKEVFPEILQDNLSVENLTQASLNMLKEKNYQTTLKELDSIAKMISGNKKQNCFEEITKKIIASI